MTYKYEWWNLTFPHTFYDTKKKLWDYRWFMVNPGESRKPPMFYEPRKWLSDMRRGGSMRIEPAYIIEEPIAENQYTGPDAPRAHLRRPGRVRFSRKADLLMFKLSYG